MNVTAVNLMQRYSFLLESTNFEEEKYVSRNNLLYLHAENN